MKRILFILFFFITANAFAQDIHFTQMNETPLLINPANAGSQQAFRASVNLRNQWSVIGEAYKTGLVSADLRIGSGRDKKAFPVTGIQVFMDRSSDARINTFAASLSFGYAVRIGANGTITAAGSGGFFQRNYNAGNLSWGNQFDGYSYNASIPSMENSAQNFSAADLGAGLLYAQSKGDMFASANDMYHFSFGFSAAHLNQPKWSFTSSGERLPIRYLAHIRLLKGIRSTSFSIEPALAYSIQAGHREFLAGSSFWYTLREESKITGYNKGQALAFGLFYRNRDAVAASLAFRFDRYTFGVNYDFNTSSLSSASTGKGGFEIYLKITSASDFVWKSSGMFN